jgi:hypothetical protein
LYFLILKENVCALRGLENDSDLQTFICNLPYKFNERINQIMEGMDIRGITKNNNLNSRQISKII